MENLEFQEQDFTTNINLKTWKKILIYLKPLKKHILFGVMFVALIAVFDALFPILTREILNYVETTTKNNGVLDYKVFIWYGVIFLIFTILQSVFIYKFIIHAGTVEVQLSYNLRKAAFEKLQSLSFNYYNNTPVGWIMARLTSDARR